MQRLVARLDRHRVMVLMFLVVVTGLLAVPMITMAPTETASTEPDGPVFAARDAIADRFPAPVYVVPFVVSDPDGDVLDAGSLRELDAAATALRADPDLGPTLLSTVDVTTGAEVDGLLTVADLVAASLPGGVAGATDAQLEAAADAVVEQVGAADAALGLSTQAERSADGDWRSPAVVVQVLGDNEVLDLGTNAINLGGDTSGEEYARDVRSLLRDTTAMQVDGVAIDVNLTSQEQGQLAGPFIGLTVLAVLLLVGLTFRSYWVLAVVGTALGALMIWLKGITNLVGFDDDLVLSLIVPIAMISFGVDFAFHAVGRYREQRQAGDLPRRALVTGMAAVGSALLLALSSDVAAFLSNVTSGIESIVNFGIGAAIALAAAFVLLGVATPLAVSLLDDRLGRPPAGRRAAVVRVAGSIAAAAMVMGAVLLMVFVAPLAGVALWAVAALAIVVVPAWWRGRRVAVPDRTLPVAASDRLAAPIGRLVAATARRPVVVVVLAAAVTAGATVLALQVPTRFEVEDYFAADSEFVVGLDRLDEHVGSRQGEPTQLYVEGDLTDPGVVARLGTAVDEIVALDSTVLARDADGVVVDGGLVAVVDATMASPIARARVAEATGVAVTDDDGDGLPDDAAQVAALVEVAGEEGVVAADGTVALTPNAVVTTVDLDGAPPATVFALGLTDSRSQSSIGTARDELTPVLDELRADLDDVTVELTGSSFVRDASLQATSRALAVSLPVAVVLCLLIAMAFLRSVRFAIASILPILMTVAWLYAVMELMGAALNIVTATIAAVSIGIGIDFAIHFIARFREELDGRPRARDAIRVAAEGTGTALVASAVSSAVGFGILAFAPMPLFATYGLLTAIMVVLALVATLAVLPSVLVLITPRSSTAGEGASADRVDSTPLPVG